MFHKSGLGLLFALTALSFVACREEPSSRPAQDSAEPAPGDMIRTGDEPPPNIVFPDAQRAEDPTVNEFLQGLMTSCAKGDYMAYRLAVASQYDPLPRANFERVWHAIKEVRIRRLMRVAGPSTRAADSAPDAGPKGPIYGVHATVTMRDERRAKAVREVVVLLVREAGEWKLGPPAPASVKYEIMGIQSPAGDLVTVPGSPSGQETTDALDGHGGSHE